MVFWAHTIENLNFPEDELIRDYLGDPREKMRTLFDSDHPLQMGVVQNQDAYMQGKIAQRYYYDKLPGIIVGHGGVLSPDWSSIPFD